MNYYELLNIAPTDDLDLINIAIIKQKYLQLNQRQEGDLANLNLLTELKYFFSRHAKEYYDYITNPSSCHKVPKVNIFVLKNFEQYSQIETLTCQQPYTVEMDSFAFCTLDKVCHVYPAFRNNLNDFPHYHPLKYFDVDTLCVSGVNDGLILVVFGETKSDIFKAIAHISPLQNMHIVHANLVHAINHELGTITKVDYFLFGGTQESIPLITSTNIPGGIPFLSLKNRLPNIVEQINQDKNLTVILGDKVIIIQQHILNEGNKPYIKLYKQSYDAQKNIEEMDISHS